MGCRGLEEAAEAETESEEGDLEGNLWKEMDRRKGKLWELKGMKKVLGEWERIEDSVVSNRKPLDDMASNSSSS